MSKRASFTLVALGLIGCAIAWAATTVPTDIQQPGTQPGEVSNLETPDKCDNCHGNYNEAVEPAFNWRGSMMANAGRDPIFWATLAIAEQDFDGSGDLCIRCHSTAGWLAGRSTPTDGSGLTSSDSDGVECDFCHSLTNPDNSEHVGVQIGPFVANDGAAQPAGYYGSGMASIWGGSDKLGPYGDAVARHQFLKSSFHRSSALCGTCHDVSNPAVGDLAHNNGAQTTADPVVSNGVPGSSVVGKAAFNNFPFQYGVVERTFSEHLASAWPTTRVRDYATLPAELQAGAAQAAYETALIAGTGGDYEDNETRYFTCQTCHLRPVQGVGANKRNAPTRGDLPLHDMTGGNYWMPEAIKYLDAHGKLRLGGGLSATQIAALDAGAIRAIKQLSEAATLQVSKSPDYVRVINHTGHKLISGYPEGRRMWLHVTWYDSANNLLREDGRYGDLAVQMDLGGVTTVRTLLDLHDPNTKVYEAHYGMTQEWAAQLIALDPGYAELPLSYDRVTGAPDLLLADLAAQGAGSTHETFHFVLNNTVVKDNRIPPYGFAHEEARKRNALPVPESQYGLSGGVYEHFDVFELSPPGGATYATIELMYQPTSWEYIQFLYLANNQPAGAFLADEGANLLEAWLATGMAEPYVMATAAWGQQATPPTPFMWTDQLATLGESGKGKSVQLTPTSTFAERDAVVIRAHLVDEAGVPLSGGQVFVNIDNALGTVSSMQGFTDDFGSVELRWRVPRGQAPGTYTVVVTDVIKSGYQFDPVAAGAITTATFSIQ